MEWGCLASSPSTPTTFINNGTLHSNQSHKTPIKSFPKRATYCSYPLNNKNSRRTNPLSVKASNKSFTTRNQTVNSHWSDGSNHSADSSPSWLPRFEELDPTDMLLRQRIVFLGSQVDDYTADFIIGQLLYLDAEDPKKDIKLFINSPGGSVTAAMGIYDAMKLCKADVSTICMGLAASMAAFILATGTKGKRFCMPNARVMIHQQKLYAQGDDIEWSIQIRETTYQNIKMKKILSRVTGKPVEQIENDTEGDFFMSPWEAKEYGLVDEVIDDGKPGLVAPLADSSPSPSASWFLWGTGPRPTVKDLPSEEKMSQNGKVGGSGADEVEQEKEAASPV